MKILHIHLDKKFVSAINAYQNDNIQNTLIFLGEPFENQYNILFYDNNRKSFKQIAKLAEEYDVVVFMSMCHQNAIICNLLPMNVKVIWRFFGGELYPYIYKEVLTTKSLKYFRQNHLHKFLSAVKNYCLYGGTADTIFWKAVRRCDGFFCLSETEYYYLKRHFNQLPPYINVPYIKLRETINYDKEKIIIIGHSADIYGNHLDIIDILKYSKSYENNKYIVFLSYSHYSKQYTKAIINEFSQLKNVELITDFLPRESFNKIQDSASALVVNSIRQLAMGNIFSALRKGVKVYLNPQNVMYKWFIDNGMKIFSTENLHSDIESGNIALKRSDMDANLLAVNNLSEIYSNEKFLQHLFNMA